jgi:hypothetical protein
MAARGRAAQQQQQLSILEDMGESSSECGYCGAAGTTSISHGAQCRACVVRLRAAAAPDRRRAGMWAHRLLVDDYQGALHCVRNPGLGCEHLLTRRSLRAAAQSSWTAAGAAQALGCTRRA